MLLATCAFALPAAESTTTNIAGITGRIMKNLPASCGTPSGTQRPAICWHPARPRCVPSGWATRARTALRLPSAMGSAAAIELTSTHLRGNVSTAARWTACRRYALYEKKARRCANTDELQGMMSLNDFITPMISQNRRFYNTCTFFTKPDAFLLELLRPLV